MGIKTIGSVCYNFCLGTEVLLLIIQFLSQEKL